MSQTFTFHRLQQIDSQIDRVRYRLSEINLLLEDDALLSKLRAVVEQVGTHLLNAKQDLIKAEAEVKQQQIKIEQINASLYSSGVRNPKELLDLQNELISLKKFLITLEDRQLQKMMDCDKAEEENRVALTEYHTASSINQAERTNLESEKESLNKEMVKLSSERGAASSSVSSTDLTLYDMLRTQHHGVAVATVTDGSCDACGSSLSPSHVQSIRTQHQIVKCPSCGRILYGQ